MKRTRQIQLADQIRDIISTQLIDEISDPRLSGVVVTHAELTRDLQLASLYCRSYNDLTEWQTAEKAFQSCKGRLKRKLSKSLGVRRVPELRFFFDKSVEEGSKIEKLISEIKLQS